MTHRILCALSPKLAEPASSLEIKKVQEAAEELQRQARDEGGTSLSLWTHGGGGGTFLSLWTHGGGRGLASPLDPTFLLFLSGDELSLATKK